MCQDIDQIKMTKRNLIQSRRRCYVAKTRESLGPYWTPRYGPKCTSHIEADHATVPLKNCHPEHIQGIGNSKTDFMMFYRTFSKARRQVSGSAEQCNA